MKRSLSSLRSSLGKVVLAVVAVAAVSIVTATTPVFAQQPAQRVVEGKVVDKSDAPVKGAVVYLKDGHTLGVKSAISGDGGTYRFGQLSQNTDYELWATSGDRKSGTKTISSFDDKKLFRIDLKLNK